MAEINEDLKYETLDYILTNMMYNPTVLLNNAQYNTYIFKSMYMDYKNQVIVETQHTEFYILDFEWDVIVFLYRQLKKFIRTNEKKDALLTQEVKEAETLFEF